MAYIIYLAVSVFIIYRIGKLCHSNGRVFILQLFRGDTATTDTINNILLLAYYLFNTGYALLRLKQWRQIHTTEALIASLSSYIGILVLILAVTHYGNILLIYILSKKNASLSQNKHL